MDYITKVTYPLAFIQIQPIWSTSRRKEEKRRVKSGYLFPWSPSYEVVFWLAVSIKKKPLLLKQPASHEPFSIWFPVTILSVWPSRLEMVIMSTSLDSCTVSCFSYILCTPLWTAPLERSPHQITIIAMFYLSPVEVLPDLESMM